MSNFEVFVGVAVEDKELSSRQLKVFLRELTPFAGGKLADNTRTETYTIANETGDKISGNVKTTNNVVADFFGLSTNSAFPPDVVAGEQVYVLKYADEDKYYWISAGRDDNLRKGEIIRMSASGEMSSDKTLSENNTYFVELDTKLGKRIRIHTSKTNGEAFGYDVIIDAANNFISISDDTGNSFELASQEKRLTLKNSSGSVFNIVDQNISILAEGVVAIKSSQEIVLSAPKVSAHGALSNNGDMTNKGNMNTNGNITASGTVHGSNIH